jgi:hypothetical protein
MSFGPDDFSARAAWIFFLYLREQVQQSEEHADFPSEFSILWTDSLTHSLSHSQSITCTNPTTNTDTPAPAGALYFAWAHFLILSILKI